MKWLKLPVQIALLVAELVGVYRPKFKPKHLTGKRRIVRFVKKKD